MNSTERVAVIEQGIVTLRFIETERRAQLPPPERDDAALLRELRDVAALANRLELAIEGAEYDQDSVFSRDASLSMGIDDADAQFVLALAEDRGAGALYRNGRCLRLNRRLFVS